MERHTPNSNMAPPYYGQSNGQVNGNAYSYPNNTTNYQASYQTPYQTSYQGPYQNYYPNNNQNNYYANSTNSNNTYSNSSNTNPPYTNTTYPNTTPSNNNVSGNNSYNNSSYHNNADTNNPYNNNPYNNNPYNNNPYNNNSYGNNPYTNNPYQQPKNQTNTYASTNPMPNQVQTNYRYQQPKEIPPVNIAPPKEESIPEEPSSVLKMDSAQVPSSQEVMPEPPIVEVPMEVSIEESYLSPSTESSTEVVQDMKPLTKEDTVAASIPELNTSHTLSKDDEAIVKQLQDTFGDELTSEVTQALRESSENTATTVSSMSDASVATQSTPSVSPAVTTSFVEQEVPATPIFQKEPSFTPPRREPSSYRDTVLTNQANVTLKAASNQSTTTDSPPVKSEKVMSVGAWFGTLLLLLIPGVNIILMIVWACGCGNKNRCNMMRASLLLGMILTIIVTVLLFVFRDNLNVMIHSIEEWISYLNL